jgi:hypothetical protein
MENEGCERQTYAEGSLRVMRPLGKFVLAGRPFGFAQGRGATSTRGECATQSAGDAERPSTKGLFLLP